MSSSTFQHKCGSKRKNHQCGLGLCSAETELGDFVLPQRRKLRSDSKPKFVPNIDVDKDSNPEKLICKICNKCARPIKGHPLPKGNKCNLEPLPIADEIQIEKQSIKKAKARERNKTDAAKAKARERKRSDASKAKARERNKSEAALSKARERKKSEEALSKARDRNKSEAALSKARERKKSDAALTKARVRNKTIEAMSKSKARSLAARKYRKRMKEFFGWSNIDEKNPVEKHILPNMTETCTDCGAKMFPWERSKMKNDKDKTFSLCCSYGTVKLTPFKDPSPKLKKLFENTSSQSTQFLANIRKYNGLVAMSSKCITGKLTDFSKFKSRGPNIYKMSGQMYHLLPNVLPVAGKKAKFSQIYVYDTECEEAELDERLKHVKEKDKKIVKRETLKLLQEELKKINPYVTIYI